MADFASITAFTQQERRTRLDLLEPEVLALILEYVNDTSPHTIKSVALTCRYFNSFVKLIANRHKTIRFHLVVRADSAYPDTGTSTNGDNVTSGRGLPDWTFTAADVVKEWASNPDLLAQLRTLTVNEPKQPLQVGWLQIIDHDELWAPLVDLLSKVARLRSLTWNLPTIPLGIIHALHRHQRSATLRLFKFQPSPADEPTKVDKAIAKSSALTHIRTVLEPRYAIPSLQETSFRRIVALAPSLEYAGIVNRVGDPLIGELHRKDPFRTSNKPNRSIKALTLDGYSLSKATLEDWGSIVDLSCLENVKFSRGLPELDYFQNAAALLPNLKHVSLNLHHISRDGTQRGQLVAAVQNYLSVCSPLESLSLWSWMDIVDLEEVLSRHGPTLKSLQLHMRESQHQETPRRCLTVDQVRGIINSCKQLKELTFDLNRSSSSLSLEDDLNVDYFSILKKSKLDLVQLYFDQGLTYCHLHPDYDSPENQDDSAVDESDGEEGPDDGEERLGQVETDHVEGELDGEAFSSNLTASVHDSVAHDAGQAVEGSQPAAATREPSPKRIKLSDEPVPPSKDSDMKTYVENIWKLVFQDSWSAGKLDVKFGEWESMKASPGWRGDITSTYGRMHTRYFMARHAERDDQKDKCLVSMKTLQSPWRQDP